MIDEGFTIVAAVLVWLAISWFSGVVESYQNKAANTETFRNQTVEYKK